MVRLAFRHFFLSLATILLVCAIMIGLSPRALSNILSSVTETKVSLEKIKVGYQELLLNNLIVDNPKGYIQKQGIEVGAIDFKARLLTYLLPNIMIHEVILSDINLDIEYSNRDNTAGNWLDIMKNVDRLLKHHKSHKSHFKGRVVKIDQLTLKNLNITVKKYNEAPQHFTIDQIVINNIATQRGAPFNQIVHTMIQEIVVAVTAKLGMPNMLSSIVIVPAELIQVIFEPFALLFGAGSSD